MLDKSKNYHKEYWEKNIVGYAGFYDKTSEENIDAPFWLRSFYKAFLFPVEKKFTLARYAKVCKYIDDNVRPGMIVADIGCGDGVFTRKLVQKKAKVYALDFASSALRLCRERLTRDEAKSVEFIELDITQNPIPTVDLAIAVGVVVYLKDTSIFFDHCLPYTEKLLFNILDAQHPLNRLRMTLKLLDVRKLCYTTVNKVEQQLAFKNFRINSCEKLATGYIITTEKIRQ